LRRSARTTSSRRPVVTAPVVTALAERPRGRVRVELDGKPWRVVPSEAVVRAGIAVGRTLDRETARTLGRELRRAGALGVAVKALRYRDLSRHHLEERLATRVATAAARADALETLERAGLLDDARVAAGRAQVLAERGYGDAAIRAALEQDGIGAGLVEEALSRLEAEHRRARALLERQGADPRTLRRLAALGFDASVLEELAGFADGA
jgi:SOS response regulatory protein OraA/RecX